MTAPELKPCPDSGMLVWAGNTVWLHSHDGVTWTPVAEPPPTFVARTELDAHIGAVLAEAASIAYPRGFDIAREIQRLAPDALTALDRAKREARIEGMREALDEMSYSPDLEWARGAVEELIEAFREGGEAVTRTKVRG